MAKPAPVVRLNLPWVRGHEDHLFTILNLLAIVFFIMLVVWLNRLQVAELERKELAEVAPGLARLILDKPPAPKPPKELEKITPPLEKPEPVKPPEIEPRVVARQPEPVAPPRVEPPPVSSARQKAARSGLLAFSDELADLRDHADLDLLDDAPTSSITSLSETITSATDELIARSQTASGGIADANLARGHSQQPLLQRQVAEVESNLIDGAEAAMAQQAAKPKVPAKPQNLKSRSRDEVEKVFQTNKGPIYGIYNRALRQNPKLQGRVVVELTIAADGTITDCRLLSSELGDEELESRLVSRIKRFRFQSRKVDVTTVTYPIDFLPS